MSRYARGEQAAIIRAYIKDHPKARPVEVSRALGVSVQAVSLERRNLGMQPLRTIEARKRRLTVNELDAAILRAVYDGNLVTAVLDDSN